MPGGSMPINPTSVWENPTEVSLDEFFLKHENFPKLYEKSMELHEKSKANPAGKQFPKPIEQLSPKGLAIASHLYAKKDNNEAQPLVATSEDDLKHIITLMDNAPPGTKVTVTFQAADKESLNFFYQEMIADVHKSVFTFEKTDSSLRMLNMDSVGDGYTCMLATSAAQEALEENAKSKGREPTFLQIASEKKMMKPMTEERQKKWKQDNRERVERGEEPPKQEPVHRQVDEYQCGVYSLRDARILNRDPTFFNGVFTDKTTGLFRYDLPPEHRKGTQSRADAGFVLQDPSRAEKVVTRKGKTLKQTLEKHVDTGYARHFSEKYKEAVTEFVQNNPPSEVRKAVERYDAGKMTQERLDALYGPKTPAIQSKASKETKEPATRPQAVMLHKLGKENVKPTTQKVEPAKEKKGVKPTDNRPFRSRG